MSNKKIKNKKSRLAIIIGSSVIFLHLIFALLFFSKLFNFNISDLLRKVPAFKKHFDKIDLNKQALMKAAPTTSNNPPIIFIDDQVKSPEQKNSEPEEPIKDLKSKTQTKSELNKPKQTKPELNKFKEKPENKSKKLFKDLKNKNKIKINNPELKASPEFKDPEEPKLNNKILEKLKKPKPELNQNRPILKALAPSSFIKFNNANGTHVMSQMGNKNIKPELADLKRLSYRAKLMRQFGDAFNAYKVLYNIHNTRAAFLYLSFTVNSSGEIININISPDNLPKNIIAFIYKTLEYASPFPAIPKHLNQNSFTLGPFSITLRQGKLIGNYSWSDNI